MQTPELTMVPQTRFEVNQNIRRLQLFGRLYELSCSVCSIQTACGDDFRVQTLLCLDNSCCCSYCDQLPELEPGSVAAELIVACR